MKLILFAHRLEVGGTQVNAIELAARLRDYHGIDTVLHATPGPAVAIAEKKGLRFIPAPDARFHPSLRRMRALRQLVREERADLIHAWDWWQCLEAFYSVCLLQGVPLIVSDMMMELTRILPRSPLTTFGTPQVLDAARSSGFRNARLLVPPIDVEANSPGAVDPCEFRGRNGLADCELVIVTVSRLSKYLKSESLIRTIEAVGQIGRTTPVRFFIVGEGQARPALQRLADEVNASLGRTTITLIGELSDPRPAYAAADIVVGMGGSALRGAAFGKPVVIVGEQGFCDTLSPVSAPTFFHQGIYGRGDGDPGSRRLASILQELADDAAQRATLGRFSRDFVRDRFSLAVLARDLAAFCEEAVRTGPPRGRLVDALRTSAIYLRERRFLTPSRDRIVK